MRSSMWWLLAICLCVSLPLSAQKFTGTITGVVTDPSGAVVAGAEVTVTNPSTGAVRTVKTSDHGEFVFPELPASNYDLRVTAANFKEHVTKAIELNVSSTTTVNVVMALGGATEQVVVEANAVQVETATGAVGNVIEGNSVRELPLNGRSFAQLTQLMPGVSPASNFDSKHKGLEAGVDFSVNGNNTTGNIFLVDGVNNNDIGSNRTILVYPSIDAIQEFKILRNSYGPEYGQAMGAIVSILTKSGTNQFHGSGYYFGRNDVLNARDYFNSPQVGKDKLRRNDFGYNVGGPVVKDKLFFFWSQEWNRELRGKLRNGIVPTLAEKNNGDFTNLRTSSDGAKACEARPQVGGAGVNVVPAGHTSPTGALILQLFPDPNVQNVGANCINWAESLKSPIYWREENIRADYKLDKTWSVMGRYTQDHWNQNSPSTLGYWGDDPYPSVDPNWVQPGYQATIKVTKLLGNSAVNDFQLSYAANRITVTKGGTNPGLVEQINASYTTVFPIADKFLGIHMGYPVFWGGLGAGTDGQNLWNMGPWHNNEELYILKDDFSKVHGAHTFKVGFLASSNRKNELSGGSSGEAANYWGVASNNSGNGFFNALYDQTTWGFGENATNPYALTRWHDYETYFGDTWKIRRNVTLEYGARWSFLRNPFSNKDLITSWQPNLFDPALGAAPCNGLLLVPGKNPCTPLGFIGGVSGPNRSLKQQNNHMIAPRIGIAWDPKGDGKMVFRTGVGQFYQRERLTNYLLLATNSPFSVNAGGTRQLAGAFTGTLTASAAPSWGIQPSDAMPNTWQWNFTFEKELYRDSKLELAYVGNRGGNVLQYKDANAVLPANRLAFALKNDNKLRFADSPLCGGTDPVTKKPQPGCFGTISYGQWTAHSNYNALQALFRTRMKAVDAQFAYTWSKSLANTDITNSGNTGNTANITDVSNPNMDYGPTPIDRRHVFVSNIVYNFPSLKGHNAMLRAVAGDWEAGGILQYASGPSQSIFGLNGGATFGAVACDATHVFPNCDPGAPGGIQGTGYNNNQKPIRVLQDCRNHGGPKSQWYNPAAFTLDNYQLGTFGNNGVGSCTGPGISNTDFSMYKNFKVGERVSMQFRMEFYNLFNKVQFRADQINLQLASQAAACTSPNVVNPNCVGHALDTTSWNYAQDGQGTFGRAGSTGAPGDRGPREIQYALKINF